VTKGGGRGLDRTSRGCGCYCYCRIRAHVVLSRSFRFRPKQINNFMNLFSLTTSGKILSHPLLAYIILKNMFLLFVVRRVNYSYSYIFVFDFGCPNTLDRERTNFNFSSKAKTSILKCSIRAHLPACAWDP